MGDRVVGISGRRQASRAARVALSVSLTIWLQLGCAGFPGFGPPAISPEERAAYDAAMGQLPADPRAAAVALEAYIETWPNSQLADDAAEQLAQLAFAGDRPEEGLRWLGVILRDYPDSDRAAPARLRMAQFEYARDKRATARRLLEPIDLERLSLSERRAALRLRVALSQTPVERLVHLAALRRAVEDEREARGADRVAATRLTDRLAVVDREIRELIARAPQPELMAMLRELDGRSPAAAVALELSERALDAGQLGLASERLDAAESLARNEVDRGRLRLLVERLRVEEETARSEAELPPLRALVGRPLPSTEGATGTVGVVLPLSGDFNAFGEQALRGVLLAADLFESEPTVEGTSDVSVPGDDGATSAQGLAPSSGRRGVRLLVRDSGGNPERAAAAVRELAADPSVSAVVGPIFSAESFAAAEVAEQEGVPLVTLSHRKEVPAGRAQVFRTRTTPEDEVGVLVDHAFEALEAERFAVLYPRNRYGRGMRKLYWDAVVARGGKMVAASSYDPAATDFAAAIRDMIGYRFLTHWERKALQERTQILRAARNLEPEQALLVREAVYGILGPEGQPLPPIVDFDVLFIPDGFEKIALIAPGLAYHEVQGVDLLGTSDWLDPELLRVARGHVSGAVISTPFDVHSDVPFVTDFVEGYQGTFTETPDAYAAQAFDALNLVLVQLAAGRIDRESVREGLLEIRVYPGATGVLTMRPDGNARRRPFLLGVRGRRFLPLD
jgi:ABC-type branched-subunit amino acid transport system substrate-binding protein